eukprot:scaffold207_cov409-Prasinococcus_capsulatus_cf.AAC.42
MQTPLKQSAPQSPPEAARREVQVRMLGGTPRLVQKAVARPRAATDAAALRIPLALFHCQVPLQGKLLFLAVHERPPQFGAIHRMLLTLLLLPRGHLRVKVRPRTHVPGEELGVLHTERTDVTGVGHHMSTIARLVTFCLNVRPAACDLYLCSKQKQGEAGHRCVL